MNLFDAKIRAARLLLDVTQLRDDMLEEHQVRSEASSVSVSVDPERLQVLKKAEWAYEKQLQEFASDPVLRQHMKCWVVDVCGGDEPAWVQERRTPTDAELTDAINADLNALTSAVYDAFDAAFVEVTDSASGHGGWEIGAYCTDEEMRRLTPVLRTRLAAFLDNGRLTIRLWFAGWSFVDVRGEEQAKEILRKAVS